MEHESTRKYYIDNLRSLCILLLFPFHAAMMYVDFGEAFYVQGKECRLASLFNQITFGWWMSGLFVFAGISTVYAFRHRTWKMYVTERLHKLFIPLISSMLFLVPIQCYIADIFHNGYSGSYREHFKIFFTVTDLTGYDGHMTPAHTWFILYLFLISLITLPLLLWHNKREKKIDANRITIPRLYILCIPIIIMSPILNLGGKSIGEYTAYFLFGYFFLSQDEVQNKLKIHSTGLGIAWILLMIARCISYNIWKDGKMADWQDWQINIYFDIVYRIFSWTGILAMIGLGKHFLEFHTPLTQLFAKASFPIYLFHQPVLVIVGFFVLKLVHSTVLQYILIVLLSFGFTILLYVLCRQSKTLRFLFSIKK